MLRMSCVVGPHLNAACAAYRWRHTLIQIPILHRAEKVASAIVKRGLVDNVDGIINNVVRYTGKTTVQNVVRFPSTTAATICAINTNPNNCGMDNCVRGHFDSSDAVITRNTAGTAILKAKPTSLTCIPPRTYHGRSWAVKDEDDGMITLGMGGNAAAFLSVAVLTDSDFVPLSDVSRLCSSETFVRSSSSVDGIRGRGVAVDAIFLVLLL